MIGSVYTVAFLVKTPPTFYLFYILFAVLCKAGMSVFFKWLGACSALD